MIYVAIHFVLAALALVFVFIDKLSTKSQKGYQALFVTLVPLVGSILTIIMFFYKRAKPSSAQSNVGDSAADHIRKFGHWK